MAPAMAPSNHSGILKGFFSCEYLSSTIEPVNCDQPCNRKKQIKAATKLYDRIWFVLIGGTKVKVRPRVVINIAPHPGSRCKPFLIGIDLLSNMEFTWP